VYPRSPDSGDIQSKLRGVNRTACDYDERCWEGVVPRVKRLQRFRDLVRRRAGGGAEYFLEATPTIALPVMEPVQSTLGSMAPSGLGTAPRGSAIFRLRRSVLRSPPRSRRFGAWDLPHPHAAACLDPGRVPARIARPEPVPAVDGTRRAWAEGSAMQRAAKKREGRQEARTRREKTAIPLKTGKQAKSGIKFKTVLIWIKKTISIEFFLSPKSSSEDGQEGGRQQGLCLAVEWFPARFISLCRLHRRATSQRPARGAEALRCSR